MKVQYMESSLNYQAILPLCITMQKNLNKQAWKKLNTENVYHEDSKLNWWKKSKYITPSHHIQSFIKNILNWKLTED